MTKNLKLNIKNLQIAGAINLGGLKEKLSKKKEEPKEAAKEKKAPKVKEVKKELPVKKEAPAEKKKKPVKAKKEAAPSQPVVEEKEVQHEILKPEVVPEAPAPVAEEPVVEEKPAPPPPAPPPPALPPAAAIKPVPEKVRLGPVFPTGGVTPQKAAPTYPQRRPDYGQRAFTSPKPGTFRAEPFRPNGNGIRRPPPSGDLVRPVVRQDFPPRYPREGRPPMGRESRPPMSREGRPPMGREVRPPMSREGRPPFSREGRPPFSHEGRPPMGQDRGPRPPFRPGARSFPPQGRAAPPPQKDVPTRVRDIEAGRVSKFAGEEKSKKKGREVIGPKPGRKTEVEVFDARTRHGIVEEGAREGAWKSRRRPKLHHQFKGEPIEIVRPSKIKIPLPITIKDLAVEMKLKASELISKLFIQGITVTLNDSLSDPDVVQLLGHDFGCEITIDTSREERIRVSNKNVRDEIKLEGGENLKIRPPVVAFMGHVDHGKTSLIDAIRHSNRAAKEVGAITQHIGAFCCETKQGPLTIIDTPGHEAFTLMRERGAQITDIVVLVVAGDEGVQEQTIEAIKQAREAQSTIVVALTKNDKPNFDANTVYRQLADHELLPEIWGGKTVTVSCSAVTGEGVTELLEMLALQAEILELKANPQARARGSVIESEMQQGLGAVATVLVQNGTLHIGDALVFGTEWAKVKTMRDENSEELLEAGPSTPVQITGLSGLPEAGEEFIVVKNDKEAREIAAERQEGKRQLGFQKKKMTMESFMEGSSKPIKKIFNIVLRADVQGSMEALIKALEKIKSDKIDLQVVSHGIGQISESDVLLAATSKATILGFHTQVEAHADPLIKQNNVKVILHEIIYHAVDEIKELMKQQLEKIAIEEERGKAEVKALFKSSQLGLIAGCLVTEGSIARSHQIRVFRGKEMLWKGGISSLKRVKEDVREVLKGLECGIVLAGFSEYQEGDILESFEVTYISQEL